MKTNLNFDAYSQAIAEAEVKYDQVRMENIKLKSLLAECRSALGRDIEGMSLQQDIERVLGGQS